MDLLRSIHSLAAIVPLHPHSLRVPLPLKIMVKPLYLPLVLTRILRRAHHPPPPEEKVHDTFLYYSRRLVPSKLIKSKHKSSFYYFNMRWSFTLALFAFSAISSVLADKYLYVSLAISFLLHLTKCNSAFEVHSQFCTAPGG